MKVRKEDLVQTQFAQIMKADGGGTLLNYGFLDGGFYLSSGTLPSCRWFCRLNLNGFAAFEQPARQLVEQGAFDFIVVREEGPFGGMEAHYERVCTLYQEYEGTTFPYSLFRKKS